MKNTPGSEKQLAQKHFIIIIIDQLINEGRGQTTFKTVCFHFITVILFIINAICVCCSSSYMFHAAHPVTC